MRQKKNQYLINENDIFLQMSQLYIKYYTENIGIIRERSTCVTTFIIKIIKYNSLKM